MVITDAEKAAGQSKLASFFKRPEENETAEQKAARLKTKSQPAVPRQATYEFLVDLMFCMRAIAGVGWSFVLNQDHLLTSPTLQAPKFIVVCTDEEGKQPAGINFLKWEKNAFVEFVRGPIHRRTNDSELGFASVGLLPRMRITVADYNVKYGPWRKAMHNVTVKSLGQKISDCTSPNEPSLVLVWPRICIDRSLDPVTHNTSTHRMLFLAKLPQERFVQVLPPKASLARFGAYSHSAQWHDPDVTAYGWYLMQVCIHQGWSAHVEDFFSREDLAKLGVHWAGF